MGARSSKAGTWASPSRAGSVRTSASTSRPRGPSARPPSRWRRPRPSPGPWSASPSADPPSR
ncbi:hypothetical protein EVA_19507 [gut metagenome]|uniref:Uncharacterized protein n=1 Tax=gut metagenome TaxID=749906 RepID=J9FS32_9ZZZZ